MEQQKTASFIKPAHTRSSGIPFDRKLLTNSLDDSTETAIFNLPTSSAAAIF
jgi:hypothetical protein